MESPQQAPTELALTSRQERAIAARDAIAIGGRPAPLVPRTFIEAQAMSGALASSDLIPRGLKDRAADVLVILMAGSELGLAPMQSLRLHHVIEGVPRLSSDGLAAIVLASPECEYLDCADSTDQRSTWVTKRRGRPERSVTWTIERARRAGLVDRKNRDGSPGMWARYPENMLNARARAELCRMVYPDVVGGLITREEAFDSAIDAEFTEVPARPTHAAPPPGVPMPPADVRQPQSDPPRRGPGRPPKARPDPALAEAPPKAPEPPPAPPPMEIQRDIGADADFEPPAPPPMPTDETSEPASMFDDPDPASAPGAAANEFESWLASCRSMSELEQGRARWVAYSKEHYKAGSPEVRAMQQKYEQRLAALRGGGR